MNAARLLGPENDCDFCGSCEPINTFLVRTQRFLSLLSHNVTHDDDEASLNLDSTKNGLMEGGVGTCTAANHEGIIKVLFLKFWCISCHIWTDTAGIWNVVALSLNTVFL